MVVPDGWATIDRRRPLVHGHADAGRFGGILPLPLPTGPASHVEGRHA
jgi:hypothetical protein